MNKRSAIEKLFKARAKLTTGHTTNCPVDVDPDYMGECKCGGSSNTEVVALINDAIDEILK